IVKEMHSINASLGITLDSEGCMVINADVEPSFWAIMVKQKDASPDGWYWGNYTTLPEPPVAASEIGNPPIIDRSGFTSAEFLGGLIVPEVPDPLWYPTGYVYESDNKIPDVVLPSSEYGSPPCINCHASAAEGLTYSSLDNILGPGLRYKHYGTLEESDNPNGNKADFPLPVFEQAGLRNSTSANRAGGEVDNYVSPFSMPLPEPDPEFLEFYDELGVVAFPDEWELRLPDETYDHVVSKNSTVSEFITSDQCSGCHDAAFLNSALPNMILEEPGPDVTNYINLSPYGEWKVSPMGLAGRDPVFFSQLEGETNNLPEYTACIENTCLHCHGVMGQRQLATDTEGQDFENCKSLFVVEPPS
ncbi:MAG: hypothetical protein ACREOP_07535, partial [Thermodesulfobacteriota bacterium]